jgi:alkylation response protein AidB-like acyl-CoA dehydrogenase
MADYTPDDLDQFRERARSWLQATMPRTSGRAKLGQRGSGDPEQEPQRVERARELQRILYDGGFAGIAFPKQYGGQGLSAAHQRIFAEESAGYETPLWLNMSTLGAQAPTILDFGTEEQKRRHIPAILRGEEFWCQLLSEPSGGSDLAGVLTRADRDGETWVLNGSKIWTSGAHLRDFGLCLARTDWDVPKHGGLTMFIVDLHAPGVEVLPIPLANGTRHFCQEFFTDVILTADSVLGEVNDGWAVAQRLMVHERNMVGGGSPYAGVARSRRTDGRRHLMDQLVELGHGLSAPPEAEVRRLLAEAQILTTARVQMIKQVTARQRAGDLPGSAGSLMKLMTSTVSARVTEITMQLAGTRGVAWDLDDPAGMAAGSEYLLRQTVALGGGTSEIQRNIISERLLGMPKEQTADKNVPFRQVRRNSL